MPIWLRQYYLKKIIDFNEDQGAKMAEQQAPEDQPRQRSGIGSLLEETDIRIPEAEHAPAQVQELMYT